MLQSIAVGGVGFDQNLGYRAKHQVSTTILSTIKVDIKTFSIDLLLFIDNFPGKIRSFTWISDYGIIATAQNLSQWIRKIWSSFRSIDTWTHVFGVTSRFSHPNLLCIFSIWKQIEYIYICLCLRIYVSVWRVGMRTGVTCMSARTYCKANCQRRS